MDQIKFSIQSILDYIQAPQIKEKLENVPLFDKEAANIILAKYAGILLSEIYEPLITSEFSFLYPLLSRVKERWEMISKGEIVLIDDAGDLSYEISFLSGDEGSLKFDLVYTLFSFSHAAFNEDWDNSYGVKMGRVGIWLPTKNLIETVLKLKPEEEAKRDINRIGAYLLDIIYEHQQSL